MKKIIFIVSSILPVYIFCSDGNPDTLTPDSFISSHESRSSTPTTPGAFSNQSAQNFLRHWTKSPASKEHASFFPTAQSSSKESISSEESVIDPKIQRVQDTIARHQCIVEQLAQTAEDYQKYGKVHLAQITYDQIVEHLSYILHDYTSLLGLDGSLKEFVEKEAKQIHTQIHHFRALRDSVLHTAWLSPIDERYNRYADLDEDGEDFDDEIGKDADDSTIHRMIKEALALQDPTNQENGSFVDEELLADTDTKAAFEEQARHVSNYDPELDDEA